MKTENLKIFKVCYNPPISDELANDIRENVNYSMISNDESSEQYNLDFIV